ncbi:MAG: energy-coupling factor transporter ATPase [Lachnospiraceae bacterium]|nr:MAG: energy-coupling factor transporter ATPase [Lachnospiraceae bacterium]
MKPVIQTKDLVYEYYRRDEEGNVESIDTAVDHVNLDVEPGQFISILGHNGSGKSTLAKHINALLIPTEGTVIVDGKDTKDPANELPVRKEAGMVFQNPDNQIIASVVEEDVGFGPENIGVPTDEIWERAEKALKGVGMWEYRKKSPNRLSGGQKQRVAIAGVMAMEPKCIILDEPTAMLDPDGRREVIDTARELNKKKGVTIILITHYMEEVVYSDRVFVMDHGRVVMQGTPREIFSQVNILKSYHLTVPQVTDLAFRLKEDGMDLPDGVLTRPELEDSLSRIKAPSGAPEMTPSHEEKKAEKSPEDAVLILDHVSVTYKDGGTETHALNDVSLQINKGDFIGIIGHTGSGKSTLIQTLNGLIPVTGGHVYFNGRDISEKDFDKKALRTSVGMVFQYPEHQLFETTVLNDVKFGPKNMGLDDKEAGLRAYEALKKVHFPEDSFDASPFELSGGQKRRAAIAGVIAMRPQVIILDEPTAGLDPAGRDEILGLIKEMHDKSGETVILVSHSMEDVAEYVDRTIVIDSGHPVFDGTPREVFSHVSELESLGLAVPSVTYLLHDLHKKGYPVDEHAVTVEEAREEILRVFG